MLAIELKKTMKWSEQLLNKEVDSWKSWMRVSHISYVIDTPGDFLRIFV